MGVGFVFAGAASVDEKKGGGQIVMVYSGEGDMSMEEVRANLRKYQYQQPGADK